MEIRLNNIGIVRDSTIKLDGLTVITGDNNSGKTTVGKALYSLLDAVTDIRLKNQRDRVAYIRKTLRRTRDSMEFLRFISPAERRKAFQDYPIMENFFFLRFYNNIYDEIDYEKLSKDLYKELKKLKSNDFFSEVLSKSRYIESDEMETLKELSRVQITEALTRLDKLFDELNKDETLFNYTRDCIDQTLQVEFSNQIQPIRKKVEESYIQIYNKNISYFDICIKENRIEKNENKYFSSNPFDNVFFIDDPFVLDGTIPNNNNMEYVEDFDSFIDDSRFYSHNQKLRTYLKKMETISFFEKNSIEEKYKSITEKINTILPGGFVFSEKGDFYIDKGKKLKVSNLATGSKMISILKILLGKGALNNKTMLILDEPEAHLHPSWQNLLAEMIAILVKELNVSVLLTTHSSNFMLALDAYMRKYELYDVSHFYQTKKTRSGFVDYECVDNDMDMIYQDFLKYFSEMKYLRNEYCKNDN